LSKTVNIQIVFIIMFRKCLAILAFVMLDVCLCAQTTADFLSVVPDGRAAALGGAGAALLPDAGAQHQNVARYAFLPDRGGMAVSYIPWTLKNSSDMAMYYAAGFLRFERNAISASVRYSNFGDIILTPDGRQFNTQQLNDYAIDFGYSRQITRRIAAGFAVRYVSVAYAEGAGIASSGAFAADAGVYYQQPVGNDVLTAGLSVTNVGTAINLGGNTNASLPLNLNVGAGYTLNLLPEHSFSFLCQALQPLVSENNAETISFEQATLSAGVEYGFSKKAFARFGYAYNSKNYGDRSHLAFGLGVLIYGISVDAAYLASTSERAEAIVNTLRVTIGFFFGEAGMQKREKKRGPLQKIPCNNCPSY
jgi:hypothetical protein